MRTAVLVNAPVTLSKRFYDAAGNPVDAGEVIVTITDARGAVVVVPTEATKVGDAYQLELEAQADVAVLYATWDSSTRGRAVDTVEVVGDHLFTIEEAKAATITGGQAPLAKYDAETLAQWRLYITELFEQRTGQSFISRYGQMKFRATNTHKVFFDEGVPAYGNGGEVRDVRKLLSVTISGHSQNPAHYHPTPTGIESRAWPFISSLQGDPYNIVVEYEYGRSPVPEEARRNALRLLLANAVNTDIPSRATSFNNEDGTFRLTTFPVEVEEFLRENNRRGLVL